MAVLIFIVKFVNNMKFVTDSLQATHTFTFKTRSLSVFLQNE